MHVAITGASSGIGKALAHEYARAGAKLTLVARRKEILDQIARESGAKAHTLGVDLSDSPHAADWVEASEKALGPIDVLINNAGMDNMGPTLEADLAECIALMHLNLLSPLTLAQHVAPRMAARRSGHIVNIASVAALAPVPMKAWYGASKAGFAMFSESLRYEILKSGVHVMTVYPGPINTPMADKSYEAVGGRKGTAALMPEGKPETLARLIRKGVETRKARIVYPAFYLSQMFAPNLSGWLAGTFGPKPDFS